jgi:hypothetical protein
MASTARKTVLSRELAEIVRSVSQVEAGAPLSKHLQAIKSRRAQETECFLRACAVRLGLEDVHAQ